MQACRPRIEGAPPGPLSSEQRPAIFLDRDGVINVDHGYVSTPEATTWVPGIFDLCRLGQELGYVLLVVTNQAGIGRGLYTEAQFMSYTRWMLGEFTARGISVSAVYYCPHHADAGVGDYRTICCCRKPAPGMLLAAKEDYGLDLRRSVMIGDNVSDMQAGLAAGVGTCVRLLHGSCRLQAGVGFRQVMDLSEVAGHVRAAAASASCASQRGG